MANIRFTTVVRGVKVAARKLSILYGNWHNAIDLYTLNVASVSNCVAGQLKRLYPDFAFSVVDEDMFFHIDADASVYRGKKIVASLKDEANLSRHQLLTYIWKRQILRMRKAEICQQLANATRELEEATK